MTYHPTRRTFLKHVGFAGAVLPLAMPRLVRGDSANDKLNIAFVGSQGQAGFSFNNLMNQNIVAVADVDRNNLEGRLEALRNHDQHPHDAKGFADYRRMIDELHREIDAVVVATPDHHHAQPTLAAIGQGKHVYCEKPLGHTIYETRLMVEAARRNNVATQMGTQIHAGHNYRRVVEKIQSGAIGDVSEVHVFLYGGTYVGGRFPDDGPHNVPDHLDWDLWLGAAEERDYYNNIYHPFQWRGWWDFGGGGLSDLACHYVDLPHWALDLARPTKARATSHDPQPLRAYRRIMAEYDYPAKGERPAVKLTFHMGGTHIDDVNVFEKYGFSNDDWQGNGILFVGEKGLLISNYGEHKLLPEDDFAGYQAPEPSIPASPGHHNEWVAACKGGEPALCNFDYSGPLTEAVLMGVVAHRAGNVEIEFDHDELRVTNDEDANAFVSKPYRSGWNVDRLV